MTQILIRLILSGLLLATTMTSFSQERRWEDIDKSNIRSVDTITKKKYTLIFINKDSVLDLAVKQRLIDAFFKVYPAEAKKYNKKTMKKVIFIIDPAYKGVAATSNGLVRYNPDWFHKHPGDIDVVTHEVMHIVQNYPNRAGPGWITEGIADYVRYKLGVDNEGAGWKLPDYSTKQAFDNSYRVTARFFVWIEKHYNKKFVQKLDAAMRSKNYTDNFVKTATGKTFAELWNEYSKDPAI
jgi:predicted metal-dependent peptidase